MPLPRAQIRQERRARRRARRRNPNWRAARRQAIRTWLMRIAGVADTLEGLVPDSHPLNDALDVVGEASEFVLDVLPDDTEGETQEPKKAAKKAAKKGRR